MFDELLKSPLVIMLPGVLNAVFAFLLSRIIELVPAFATWWDKQPDEYKYAYRGWAGLALAVIVVAFGFFTNLLTLDLSTAPGALLVIGSIVVGWLLFVGSAEATYTATVNKLRRKT